MKKLNFFQCYLPMLWVHLQCLTSSLWNSKSCCRGKYHCWCCWVTQRKSWSYLVLKHVAFEFIWITFPLFIYQHTVALLYAIRLELHNQLKFLLIKCPIYRFIILIFYFVSSGITINNSVNNKHLFNPEFLISLHERYLVDAYYGKVTCTKFTSFSLFLRQSFFVQVYQKLSFFVFANIFRSHFDTSMERCIVF